LVACTRCEASIEKEVFNLPGLTLCTSCGARINVSVFPSILKGSSTLKSEDVLVLDDEATCFYHPKKKAVIPCSVCGRFLCALCDVEFNGRHICTSCLETGKKKHRIKTLENHRTLYDTIVLATALIPILFVWPTIVTAPMSLFLVFRYWNAPTSIIPRTKFRLILAFILAGLQITGWAFFIYSWATR